jgi:hypothetical protein
MAKKYRKKPVVIEAVQWTGDNVIEMYQFTGIKSIKVSNSDELIVHTLEGDMVASNSDYIIKGIKGEFYPCKPDIFEQTYEEYND